MPFIAQQLTADGISPAGELARCVTLEAIRQILQNDHVDTISVGTSGGTGYAVGDTFDIDDGSNVPVDVFSAGNDIVRARVRVTSVAAGVVDGVELISAGAYSTLTTGSDFSTTTVTGAGTGCQIDIDTVQVALYTQDELNGLTDDQTDGDVLLTSTKAANAPTVGFESAGTTNEAIRMVIGSSYDGGLPWRDQPGNPPNSDFYINIPSQDPFIYISTTERRVNILVTDGTRKQYGTVGLFQPFTDVDSNYPFPAIIAGQSSTVRAFSEDYQTSNRGIVHPADVALGCYQYRNNLSTEWFGIGADATARGVIWPNQGTRSAYSFNRAPIPTNVQGSADANDYTPGGGTNGSSLWQSTPGVLNEGDWFSSDAASGMPQGPAPLGLGSQLHFTVQPHIISVQTNDTQMIGYLDGWEAVHMRGLNEFDEIQNQNGKRFLVFTDTNDTTLYRGVAMEII